MALPCRYSPLGLYYLPELVKAGYRHLRVELVDEPPSVVAPLLEAYRDALLGGRPPSELWAWLGGLPDANGRVGGVGSGSLAVRERGERPRAALKPTAAALRQQQLQPPQQQQQLWAASHS